jgi:hypothetical protein
MSLLSPPKGLVPGSADTAVAIETACDWIEASALFSGERATQSNIKDILDEEEILPGSDAAEVFVSDVWRQLRSRARICGDGTPFEFGYQEIHCKEKYWRRWPAYSFCLYLSYCHRSAKPPREKSYPEQGSLFESLVESSLQRLLPTWITFQTGWTTTKPAHLPEVVNKVAKRLGGNLGNIPRWNTKGSKERGLDLVCYREFPDMRGGFPAFFVQCASGKEFEQKLGDPNLSVWNDLVKVVPQSLPRKAFATPLSFSRTEFERHSITGEALMLDRMRLFSIGREEKEWFPSTLGRKCQKWLTPRIKTLPWLP